MEPGQRAVPQPTCTTMPTLSMQTVTCAVAVQAYLTRGLYFQCTPKCTQTSACPVRTRQAHTLVVSFHTTWAKSGVKYCAVNAVSGSSDTFGIPASRWRLELRVK